MYMSYFFPKSFLHLSLTMYQSPRVAIALTKAYIMDSSASTRIVCNFISSVLELLTRRTCAYARSIYLCLLQVTWSVFQRLFSKEQSKCVRTRTLLAWMTFGYAGSSWKQFDNDCDKAIHYSIPASKSSRFTKVISVYTFMHAFSSSYSFWLTRVSTTLAEWVLYLVSPSASYEYEKQHPFLFRVAFSLKVDSLPFCS